MFTILVISCFTLLIKYQMSKWKQRPDANWEAATTGVRGSALQENVGGNEIDTDNGFTCFCVI